MEIFATSIAFILMTFAVIIYLLSGGRRLETIEVIGLRVVAFGATFAAMAIGLTMVF